MKILIILALALLFLTIYIVLFQENFIFPGWIKNNGSNKGPDAQANRPQDIDFTFLQTGSNSEIEVWWTKRKNTDSKKRPIAVIFNGNRTKIEDSYHTMRTLHKVGIDSFTIDYSGYGRSSGTPSEKAIYNNVDTLWDFLQKDFQIKDGKNLIIIGNSLGGAPATYLATLSNSKTLVLVASFSSLLEVAREKNIIFRILSPFINHRFEVSKFIPKLHSTCITLIHGTEDEIVHFRNTERIIKSAHPKQKISLTRKEGMTHNILNNVQKDILAAIKDCETKD